MKRTLLVLGIAAMAMLTAAIARAEPCGPDVKHSTSRVETKSSLETNPPTDKALVYIFLSTRASPGLPSGGLTWRQLPVKVSADRVWIGANSHESYFVAALEPGTHDFCSKSGRNVARIKLTVKAGKSYFLEQNIIISTWNSWTMHGPTNFQELAPEEGAVLLRKRKRMEFSEKN